ncbi:putative kelch-type beta propeller [Helianthus anomalus]
MPCLPEFENGLPLFCGMVAVGSDLVVMGGYDPRTWDCLNFVFIFDFLSSKWRRGADMPGGPKSFLVVRVMRDECQCLFYRGKFHVINGYSTNMQGHFHQSIEVFETYARKWSESNGVLSETTNTPQICVGGTNKKLYTCHANDVVVLRR